MSINGLINLNDYGITGDPASNDSPQIQSLINQANGNSITFLVTIPVQIKSSLTIPSNVSLEFHGQGKFVIAAGNNLTIDGYIIDTLNKIFDIPLNGSNELAFVKGLRKNDFIRPEWFGALGNYNTGSDTGNNDSTAFQIAINTIERENLNSLQITSSRYYFEKTVIIRDGGWMLKGPNGVHRPEGNLYNGYITGKSGLDSLIDYGNNSSTVITNHFSIEGVNFYGKNGTIKKGIRYSESGEGPHRGFHVIACTFGSFQRAISFESTNPVSIHCATVNIESSYIRGVTGNSYAVYASVPIYGFRFVNNQSEQGGRIGGKISGPVTITDNMLEGQNDTIFIDSGLSNIYIQNNYFEANSGSYVIKCTATNPYSSLIIKNNYGSNLKATKNIVYSNFTVTEIKGNFLFDFN